MATVPENFRYISLTSEDRESLTVAQTESLQQIRNILINKVLRVEWESGEEITFSLNHVDALSIKRTIDNDMTIGYSVVSPLYWKLINFAAED